MADRKDAVLYVRVPRGLHASLKRQARAEDRTLSQLVNRILRDATTPAAAK